MIPELQFSLLKVCRFSYYYLFVGRLYQVEYAMTAVGQAATCLGIVAEDGIVLSAERRFINNLLDESAFSEKIYRINDDIACAVAGITADATVLINELRLCAQRYLHI